MAVGVGLKVASPELPLLSLAPSWVFDWNGAKYCGSEHSRADDAYLYTLISYIENNPVKAKMVKKLGDYKYSSYLSFIEATNPVKCLQASFMFEDFTDKQDRVEFFECAVDERLLDEIRKASNLVVTSVKEKKPDPKKLTAMFKKVKDNSERDKQILKAYNEGYSQHAIACKFHKHSSTHFTFCLPPVSLTFFHSFHF